MKVNTGKIVLSALFILLLICVFFLVKSPSNKLVVTFCDVGQGDSIYLRFPNGKDMLIDGGPNKKVLECLGRSMPFYDRQIDVVLLTHPQQDHLGGLIPVIERYNVLYFVTSPVGNTSKSYNTLKELITKKNIEVKNVYAGSTIDFDNVSFKVFWPDKSWAMTHLDCSYFGDCTYLTNNTNVLGVTNLSPNLNDYSVMGIIDFNNFEIVFTGDGDSRIQDDLLINNLIINDISDVEVLKVPHHGSKNGMTDKFLETVSPKTAIIMAGKNNRYGHPSEEILQRLESRKIEIRRTDIEGDIKLETDGVNWKVITD